MIFYLSIFSPMRWLRYGCYAGMTVMTLFYTSIWVAQLYITTPQDGKSWVEDFEPTWYYKSVTIALPSTAGSFLFDIYIFVLPVAGVMQLHMSPRRKLETSVMFLSGLA